jgi:hypothetical protein
MTWSYNTALTADKDKVRALIGDTDTTDQILSDEEITFFISQTGNIYSASARACKAIAAKFSRLTDTEIEGVSDRLSQMVKHYNDLAASYDRDAAKFGATIVPVVTGVSYNAMRLVDADTDRVDPAFTMSQFNNPPVRNVGEVIDEY